ncbi:hypothetical protein [Heterosigma akashiwo virus 01]|jgi:hypothetical protein|uniref:Uncharacterized protein n=1 Tax=Heterosigma akashiwo virus 01 TaxID=97195 RepID=A0A1C9C596_HAV01|nr:hypothetical protein D1R72_gp130 [Heterosigma akashiwo virus 01]AOM63461.1 hypothetical protein [Heterosigma akashiwo virus 01]
MQNIIENSNSVTRPLLIRSIRMKEFPKPEISEPVETAIMNIGKTIVNTTTESVKSEQSVNDIVKISHTKTSSIFKTIIKYSKHAYTFFSKHRSNILGLLLFISFAFALFKRYRKKRKTPRFDFLR